MQIQNQIVVITGAGGGIGAALASACLQQGARAIVALDLHIQGAPAGCDARVCDVTREDEFVALMRSIEADYGRIDLFCSNAGVLTPGWDVREADFALWERDWKINVQAHGIAAKTVLPGMIERGSGYLLNTVSAAGLLSSPESAIYSTTKHAALGLAEYLAFTYKRFGIGVSALCPMAVRTPMLENLDRTGGTAGLEGVLTTEDVVAATLQGISEERFLILPHPRVAEHYAKKAAHHDRWLAAMEGLQTQFTDVSV